MRSLTAHGAVEHRLGAGDPDPAVLAVRHIRPDGDVIDRLVVLVEPHVAAHELGLEALHLQRVGGAHGPDGRDVALRQRLAPPSTKVLV